MVHAGILHQMWAPAAVSDRQCLSEAEADVKLADQLGFESFWFGEHHFNRQRAFHGRVPVPEIFIARLAAVTRRIRLGTGVKVLPIEPAARFAEKMALLDLLTDGRAVFGVGEGTKGSFFNDEEKGPRFREELKELVAYLRGDTSGDRPVLSPAPEHDLSAVIWTAVRNRESIELTARLGLNFATGQIGVGTDQRQWVDMYRQAGGRGEARGCRLVLVAETDAQADRLAAPAKAIYYSMMRSANADPDDPEQLALQRKNFIIGSPETVAARLLEFNEQAGVDRVDLLAHIPGLSHEALQQTLVLFASEVAPRMGVEMLAALPA